jgi:hypothetical protein
MTVPAAPSRVLATGVDERLDVALEQRPDAHRAGFLGREDRGIGESNRSELAGGLAKRDDDGMSCRVVRLLDAVMGPHDHRLIDHGDRRIRRSPRSSASRASASASPMNSS